MIDNLKNAINRAREVAENLKEIASTIPVEDEYCKGKLDEYLECIAKQEQLVAWLTQLKTVKDIVREFNEDTLGFTYSSNDFITAIIEAVSEEEK